MPFKVKDNIKTCFAGKFGPSYKIRYWAPCAKWKINIQIDSCLLYLLKMPFG
jgi:hypothetical protein